MLFNSMMETPKYILKYCIPISYLEIETHLAITEYTIILKHSTMSAYKFMLTYLVKVRVMA